MITNARDYIRKGGRGVHKSCLGDLDALKCHGWRERAIDAKTRGQFTEEDRRLASWWGTCGVGEQALRMPEVALVDFTVGPLDDELRELGSFSRGFTHAVNTNDFVFAEKCLDAIEDRALQIKRGAA